MAATSAIRNPWLRVILIYCLPLWWLFLLISLVHLTDPLQAGPLIILVVFILIYLFTLSTFYAAVRLIVKVVQLFVWRHKSIKMRTVYYVLSVIALAPVFMVALNTLGQLSITEVALIGVLVGIGSFYVARRRTM